MKGLLALATLMLLGGCASMKASEPVAPWTHWVCDSKAEVYWRFVDPAKKEVDVRLNQSEQVFRLQMAPALPERSTAMAFWRSTTRVAKVWFTGTLPTI